MPGDRLTLTEAGVRLGVSRRRVEAMVQAGQMPAERLGRQWTVSAGALRAVEHNRWRNAGRPLGQSSAWKLLNEELTLRAPTTTIQLDRLRRRLRARARHFGLRIHPSLLGRLGEDGRVVLGGRLAAENAGAPTDPGDSVDAYVRDSDVNGILTQYAARQVAEGANVRLHVISDDIWPFDPGQRYVDAWVAWLDLADIQDRAADPLFDRLAGGRVRA
jgi:excisionase family DNA binding protein